MAFLLRRRDERKIVQLEIENLVFPRFRQCVREPVKKIIDQITRTAGGLFLRGDPDNPVADIPFHFQDFAEFVQDICAQIFLLRRCDGNDGRSFFNSPQQFLRLIDCSLQCTVEIRAAVMVEVRDDAESRDVQGVFDIHFGTDGKIDELFA